MSYPTVVLAVSQEITPPQLDYFEESGAVPIVLEAAVIEEKDSTIKADDGVLVRQGSAKMSASSAVYNIESRTGTLWNASFTTCSLDNPDYRIQCGELTLLPNDKVRIKRASVFMSRWKIITLPTLRFRLGNRAASAFVFPRLGYDEFEGVSLAKTFSLVDTDRMRAVADARFTTRNGIQGDLVASYGMDGLLLDLPGKSFGYETMQSSAMDLSTIRMEGRSSRSIYPSGAARLRLQAALSRRQRAFDVGNEDLLLTRAPEIGLKYTGRQINFSGQPVDPRLELYPQASIHWGRYEESPSDVPVTSRRHVSILVPVDVVNLGPNTVVQPVGSYSVSSYGSGGSYKIWSYALDASHLFSNGSYASMRYIRRHGSGFTPFEFDDVDIKNELQAAAQANLRKHVLGLALNYDIDGQHLYEWEFLYAHKTDCLLRSVKWNSRLKRLSIDVALINL